VASPNTFAGARLDRVTARRSDAAWVAERLADPVSRAVVAAEAAVLVEGDGLALPGLAPLLEAGARPLLLGMQDGRGLFAVDADGLPASVFGDAELVSVRDIAPRLAQDEGGLIAYAAALLNWHRRHRFCANCGSLTEVEEAGLLRRCPACGAEHHPRTDPVVIMLVCDADRAILGRQRQWPAGRYSALAGFVEPGESLEEAVAREVREESGVRVTDVEYRSSQPWPFPTSLMLGFRARWAEGEPAVHDGELEDVRWCTREELVSGAVLLPPREAIARRLIDEWLGREAPGSSGRLAVS